MLADKGSDPVCIITAVSQQRWVGCGLPRFQLWRAFKESTGLSPHVWLRQHRLEQVMTMLRDTD
ncbi:AraC-like DNA-binding protein [Rhizobium tibeticum]|nr:AraC-like DNA-binding protein [Rhizobium tibeticum]